MIRIKVVRASHLALVVAAVLLAAALTVILISLSVGKSDSSAGAREINEAAIAVAASSGKVVVVDMFQENEHTDDLSSESFTIEVLPREKERISEAPQSIKRVLIYHTHTHEAYSKSKSDTYIEETAWRTSDPDYSIVRVGDELTRLLEGFGIEAVHDTTDHEPPKLATAYARSLQTLKKYEGQEFDLYIDLHRDAYDESMAHTRTVSAMGADVARLMILIGNGEGFEEKPDTAANLTFANDLTDRLNAIAEGICRDVLVKVGRYNQHISTPAVLIEVGHNQNTLTEALRSMPILARALSDMLAEN